MPFSALIRLRRAWGWAILLAGLSAVLCFVPLFDLLGFEFCLALSLASCFAAAHLGSVGVGWARSHGEGSALGLGGPTRAVLVLLGRSAASAGFLLAAPLVAISANALRVKNCDYLEGLGFFAMMPLASALLASAAGTLVALAVPRRALATACAIGVVLLSFSVGLWRFYAEPPVFAYDPFLGYFPGTIYDEEVSVRLPFLLSRLYNLLVLVAAALVAARLLDPEALRLRVRLLLGRRAPGLTLSALAAISAAAILFHFRAELGFAVDAAHIQSELGGRLRTAHFDIYYPRDLDASDVSLLGEDHEFRFAQLEAFFGARPDGRITSFIFESAEQKQSLMGAGRTFIAKPWLRQVYLQREGFPQRILKHELAHVFAGRFGDPLFGVSVRWRFTPLPRPIFNVGLIEGLAVAADWRPHGEDTAHQMAAALLRLKLAPPLESLLGAGFLTHAASRSYTLSGSFCRRLLVREGRAKLLQVYRSGGDFEAAYGETLGRLLGEWTTWLQGIEVPGSALQIAEERFRRPSLFSRVCGHEVASLLAEADRLSAASRFTEAASLLARVIRFDPSDPAHRLSRMRTLAASGRYDLALAELPALLAHPSTTRPLAREAIDLAGDLEWLRGRVAEAARTYERIASHAAVPLDRRVLHLKRWALAQKDDVRGALMAYLVPKPGRPREVALDVHLCHLIQKLLPDQGVGYFLEAKQLASKGHHAEAAPLFEEALRLGLPSRDFVVEAHLVLGECRYHQGELAAATRAFEELLALPGPPKGIRLTARDWLDRIAYRKTGRAPARIEAE
jgi:tetratricopeptide (TPR) repeat protein